MILLFNYLIGQTFGLVTFGEGMEDYKIVLAWNV